MAAAARPMLSVEAFQWCDELRGAAMGLSSLYSVLPASAGVEPSPAPGSGCCWSPLC